MTSPTPKCRAHILRGRREIIFTHLPVMRLASVVSSLPECKRYFASGPYGVYDLARNIGFVNLGTDHDTTTFAVASIRRWWQLEGRHATPRSRSC
jgi:hypothetical protein